MDEDDMFDVFIEEVPNKKRKRGRQGKSEPKENNGTKKVKEGVEIEGPESPPPPPSLSENGNKQSKQDEEENEKANDIEDLSLKNDKVETPASPDGISESEVMVVNENTEAAIIKVEEIKSDSGLGNIKKEEDENDKESNDKKGTDTIEDLDSEDDETKSRMMTDVETLQRYLPQVKVEQVDVPEGSGFTHQVAIPVKGYNIPLHPIVEPIRKYKYTLDHFQERAVTCVDNYQSVLVSAHTSAGKTTVAEYAIAKGLKDHQRVIYTTPIKALSNQKYREFYEAFQDVGLITGDVTINPSAGCLIMTTEILRNMLYRGSEVMREVGWVVFDEIHYMRDKERGVVWEETLILLPQKTHYVFLSATIPNAVEFAQWIAHMHSQSCHVIHTDYRPVPLHHYLYPVGGEGIHLVVDDKGNFREEGFSNAMGYLQAADGSGGRRGGQQKFKNEEESPCHKIIKMAMENDLAPVIVFSFSKKDCEVYAMQLSKLDFNSAEDKDLVEEVFTNAIDVLNKDDQKLPQVENLLPLLKRGIGIHHGGLLPLLKETIEILFAEGLIKVLFATETFAMGLNMPARTVLFTNVRKFDGKTYRWLTSGEYIQMSGRAGRRGIDDKGVSIVMIDEKITSNVGRSLLKGQADPINSAFHLTYNMVLNLMRVEEINPEFMMERSFYQFQNYNKIPAVITKLNKAEADYRSIEIPNEEQVKAYYNLRVQLTALAQDFQDFITKPKYIVPFLQSGRMVYVKNGKNDFGWGAVVNFKKVDTSKQNPLKSTPGYIVEVLIHVSESTANSKFTTEIKPAAPRERGEMKVVPVSLNVIQKISQVRLYFSNDLRPPERRMSVLRSIEEVVKRFPDGIPILDPVTDMKINEKEFDELLKNIKLFEERLAENPLYGSSDEQKLYELYDRKVTMASKVQAAKQDLKQCKSLLQMDELKCRKRVLRRLGYSSADDVIELKGRVACELTSADELLLTEMIFNGVFLDLDVAKSVALLSCLVCDERSNDAPKMTDDLSGALKTMQDMARQIAKVSVESKLDIEEDAYVEQFKPFLMDVVYEWCNGASFSKLCEMTEIYEGGIIRCMRRLEELLRQMSLAAKVIGNKELEDKFSEGVKLLKRDIVFAASLYL